MSQLFGWNLGASPFGASPAAKPIFGPKYKKYIIKLWFLYSSDRYHSPEFRELLNVEIRNWWKMAEIWPKSDAHIWAYASNLAYILALPSLLGPPKSARVGHGELCKSWLNINIFERNQTNIKTIMDLCICEFVNIQ